MPRNIYLALGDSITVGQGATLPTLTYVHHIGEYVRKNRLARKSRRTSATVVIAHSGWTTQDLLAAARKLDSNTWSHTQLVTVLIGGNDLRRLLRRQYFSIREDPITPEMVYQRLEEFDFDLEQLCALIAKKRVPHVCLFTVYNPLPKFPVAVGAIEYLNQVIRKHAAKHRFLVADVYPSFKKEEPYLIEGYRTGTVHDMIVPFRRPIHPNNAGHRRIADVFFRAFAKNRTNRSRATRPKTTKSKITRSETMKAPYVASSERLAIRTAKGVGKRGGPRILVKRA